MGEIDEDMTVDESIRQAFWTTWRQAPITDKDLIEFKRVLKDCGFAIAPIEPTQAIEDTGSPGQAG